tara:strand:+ start:260 stop:421 length:162 start_codon:yes stop_codon:yes gene_type:complete
MKFEGWRTEELQYVATLIAGRDEAAIRVGQDDLYNQIIIELRDRRTLDDSKFE